MKRIWIAAINSFVVSAQLWASSTSVQTPVNTMATSPFVASGNSFVGGGVIFPIAARSNGDGTSWIAQEILYNGAQLPGYLNSSSCNVSTTCVAVGEEGPINYQGVPLVAISNNNGVSWAVSDYFHNLSYPLNNTVLNSSACTTGANPGCVVVGQNVINGGKLYYNADVSASINNWVEPAFPISDFPGILFWVTCTQSGANDLCMAVGGDYALGRPKILIGTNNASNWVEDLTTYTFPGGQLFSVDCKGQGTNTVCAVAGQPSLLAISNSGLTGWNIINITDPDILLQSVSCSGTGLHDVCATVGYNPSTNQPYIQVSQDGGQTWAIPTIPGLPASGFFSAVNCTRTNSNTICAAVGSDDTNIMPFIVSSNDNGVTWTIKTTPGINPGAGGYYSSIVCHDNNGMSVCTASGELTGYGAGAPIMAVSADNATTWNLTNVANSPASGIYIQVSG